MQCLAELVLSAIDVFNLTLCLRAKPSSIEVSSEAFLLRICF